jgi:peptide/nickel transport system substrate-binding protein
VLGAEEVLEGRAPALAGLSVLSPAELLVTLAFPLPEFPRLLAATPAALPDAGPFVAAPAGAAGTLRLSASEHHPEGRPFASAVELREVDARAAQRLLAAGELDLVLRPEAAGGRAGPSLPALGVTVAAVAAERLGGGAEPLRRALAALDRGELARRFVRGAAEPLPTLLPSAALGPGAPRAPAPEPAGGAGPLPSRVVLLADASAPDQRALAERLQVKLFDRGVRAALHVVPAERYRARLAAGDYDVALCFVPVLAPSPAAAAGQIAYAVRGPAAARRAMAALAGASPDAARAEADRLARELRLVPLVASGLRTSLGPALQGLAPGADGALELADLWLLGAGAPAAAVAGGAP